MKKLTSLIVLVYCFFGCKSTDILPNSSGTAYEVLVVIDSWVWKAWGGGELFDVLNADVKDLPQSEPMFKISKVEPKEFDSFLRPARNIVLVSVGEKYSAGRTILAQNKWAKNQSVVMLNAPSADSLAMLVRRDSAKITDFFNTSERKRYLEYLKGVENRSIQEEVKKKFGVKMSIPSDMKQTKFGKDFVWISNGNSTARQDLIIYSTPYKSEKELEKDAIIARRDSVLKENVPAQEEGSYMTTEKVFHTPSIKEKNLGGAFCAQVSGLWKVEKGALMGGPFVSHTRIDELNNKIITIEGFVFAPGKDKRNYIRQMEAILHSAKLAHQENEIFVIKNK